MATYAIRVEQVWYVDGNDHEEAFQKWNKNAEPDKVLGPEVEAVQ